MSNLKINSNVVEKFKKAMESNSNTGQKWTNKDVEQDVEQYLLHEANKWGK